MTKKEVIIARIKNVGNDQDLYRIVELINDAETEINEILARHSGIRWRRLYNKSKSGPELYTEEEKENIYRKDENQYAKFCQPLLDEIYWIAHVAYAEIQKRNPGLEI